ncbi:MAG: cytochrome c oxidase subunit II [Bdellovibrionales bacterium]|nr:cytochrome c oxidase subunit II [Bdellovibrionales bacterium]
MPPEASVYARDADQLYSFILNVSAVAFVLIILIIAYFGIKYRRKTLNDKTPNMSHNFALEVVWTIIPALIFFFMFGWGWKLWNQARHSPNGALEIFAEGQKWSWSFNYKSGRTSTNVVYVPVNKPVKFILSSKDVIHSLFLPAFRKKQDAVPGRYTSLWIQPNKEGEYYIFCAEFCGTGHSEMIAKLKVVSFKEYAKWLSNDPYKGLSLSAIGKKTFKTSCVACHSSDSTRKIGPGFGGLWGSTKQFTNNKSALVDETYIRESILNPNAKIVKGFPKGVMPTFKGQLSEKQIRGLVEYIKDLKE